MYAFDTRKLPGLSSLWRFVVRCRRLHVALLLIPVLTLPCLHASSGEEQARTAALEFGRALTRDDAQAMRSILPTRGKVRLRLVRFGPEEGAYSAQQVQALFNDFLRQGAVRSFDLLRLQSAEDQYALAQARARVVDRDGRPADVDLHLTFQPEGDRWVLREIRETPP